MRSSVWLIAVICATAASIFVPGWKYTRITAAPDSEVLSMCSMPLTVVVIARSLIIVMRRSISSGEMPPYDQITLTTGMSTSGKMSVGMRRIDTMPSSATTIAATTKVYGRRRARRTIHMAMLELCRESDGSLADLTA